MIVIKSVRLRYGRYSRDRASRSVVSKVRSCNTVTGLSGAPRSYTLLVRGEIRDHTPIPACHTRHSHYSGVIPRWCLNIVGGKILTIPDTPATQGLSLWCFNRVGGEILTFPDTPTTQGQIPMVFQHSGGRDFDLPRHSHYSGVIPMVFQHSGGRDFDHTRHSHY